MQGGGVVLSVTIAVARIVKTGTMWRQDMSFSIQTVSQSHKDLNSSAALSSALVLMLAGNMTRSTGALLLLLITLTGAAQIILSPSPPWSLINGGAGEAFTFYEIETIRRSAHGRTANG